MRIYSQSPSRLSLCGGGTDFPDYYQEYGGAVISLAIDIRSRFTLVTGKDRLGFGKSKNVASGDPKFVTDILKEFGVKGAFEMAYDGRLRSGLGGSASSAVAVVGAIDKYLGLKMSRVNIALIAYGLEVKKLFGGVQDQMAAAHGGLNLFEFGETVNVVPLDRTYGDWLSNNILLFHTNLERSDPKIQEGFKKLTKRQVKALDRIKGLVAPTLEAISQQDLQSLGEVLDTAWGYKKESNKGVSTSRLSDMYTYAKAHGASGGKVSGAGGGGCMFFAVSGDHDEFIKRMGQYGLTHWSYKPDYQGLEVQELTL